MGGSLNEPTDTSALPRPEAAINLRLWFVLFVLWLGALTLAVRLSPLAVEAGFEVGHKVWLFAVYAFYLSLCCSFFPLPTAWIVLLMASNEVAVVANPVVRVAIVAVVGAMGTVMANLNEYHLLTYLLGQGKVARVRDTRAYRLAAEWFSVTPFVVLLAVAVLPIPVDPIRWLAVAYRYPRRRYAAAYFAGRSLRYALFAALAVWLDLHRWHIIVIQAVIVALAGLKLGHGLYVRRRRRAAGTGGGDAVSTRPGPMSCSREA
jgi:membrane protein YqaA with SNARE-associated domain